jgi:hypothetical protein
LPSRFLYKYIDSTILSQEQIHECNTQIFITPELIENGTPAQDNNGTKITHAGKRTGALTLPFVVTPLLAKVLSQLILLSLCAILYRAICIHSHPTSNLDKRYLLHGPF